jgi:hypothetical protein
MIGDWIMGDEGIFIDRRWRTAGVGRHTEGFFEKAVSLKMGC